MHLRILLVDDNETIRRRIKTALEGEKGIEVVGEAEDGVSAVALTLTLQPDVVLMDVMMPVMNGIEATRQIVSSMPKTRIVALSIHTNKRYVDAMMAAGATRFLSKTCGANELVKALEV